MSNAKYKSSYSLGQKPQGGKRYKNDNNTDFLQILEQVQCNRIDDQRIQLSKKGKKSLKKSTSYHQNNDQKNLNIPHSRSQPENGGYPGTEDIPIFITKNKQNNMEIFLNGLAHSQNKRLDSQRAANHVREYIPPPDNLLDLQHENSIATQSSSINELRRTYSESMLNSETGESASNIIQRNNPFRRSTTTTILSDRASDRDRFNTIARTGLTRDSSTVNEYPIPQDLLNLSERNSLSNKSSSLSQPKQISRRPSEMSDIDDNFLNALNSFQGRRLESQRSTVAIKKLIPRLIEDKLEDQMDAIKPSPPIKRFNSDNKFKIPQNPEKITNGSKPLKTSTSGSYLMKNLSSGSLGKNYKISKSFRSTKSTSKNITARLKSKTVPDDDMFELLNKVQGHRLDDQRSIGVKK